MVNAITSARAQRRARFAVLLVVAYAALACAATDAGATYFLETSSVNFSPFSLGSNPRMDAVYRIKPITNGDDLRTADINLAPGIDFNPNRAAGRCASLQFLSFSCPASSRVGTAFAHLKLTNGTVAEVSGDINVLTPTTAGSVSSVGLAFNSTVGVKYWVAGEVVGNVADGFSLRMGNFPRSAIAPPNNTSTPIDVVDLWTTIDPGSWLVHPAKCGVYRSTTIVSSFLGVVEGFYNDQSIPCRLGG